MTGRMRVGRGDELPGVVSYETADLPHSGLRGLIRAVSYGHTMRMLCAPAAATSSARLTCSWPLTSAKSVS